MRPVLFEVGPLAIHTYGALGAAGFLLVAFVALLRGRSLGVKPERTADLVFWTAIASLAGARLFYVIQNPGHFEDPLDLLNIRTGGLVFYGALLVGIPVGSLLMRLLGMPFYAMWDVFATAFPLAHGLSRIGCFAAGCCFGTPTDLPWAVTFTDPRGVAPLGVPLHPTQLYEAAMLLAIGVVTNLVYVRKRFDGQVMLTYLLIYAIGRAAVEVFRGDEARGWFLPGLLGETLTWSQGVSVGIALFALVVFLGGARRAAR